MKTMLIPTDSFMRFASLFGLIFLFGLVACAGEDRDVVEETAVTVSTNIPATDEPEATAVPDPTIPPTLASLENGTYLIHLASNSNRSAINDVPLAVRQVAIDNDSLTFTIAFENNTNHIKQVFGIELLPTDFSLITAAGVEFTAETVSDNLLTVVSTDGIPPGAANVGTLTFSNLPLPETTTYTLQFADGMQYEPILLDLTTLVSANDGLPPVTIANGQYPLDVTLFSPEEVLAPIKLHLNSITLSDETILFDVNFTNDSFSAGYEVLPAPTGFDAWLLDSDRQGYAPLEVSDSLSFSVTGDDGLDSGEINQGTITFPRLAEGDFRFIFNSYVAAQFTINSTGELFAQLISPDGETAVDQPLPLAADVAYTAVEGLLAQYCTAVIDSNNKAYLALFSQPTPELEIMFTDFTRLPLTDCTATLNPDSYAFSGAEDGYVNRLNVWLELLPEGVSPNNPFLVSLDMTFQKPDQDWLITDVTYEDDPPVWSLPDTILTETEHFYVLASTQLQEALPTYLDEVEQAYQTLLAEGLPIQGKYLALFIATTAEYRRLTGVSTSGVAPATTLPSINGTDTIRNINRHFFIDIEAMAEFPDSEVHVVTHELVHVVMQEHGRGAMPIWLVEGVAEYYSGNYKRILDREFQQVPSIHLSRLMHGGSINPQQYAFSGLFITFLVDTYGEQTFLDFFYAYSQRPSSETESGQMELVTEQLAGQFFGLSLSDLDASFHNWLTTYER